MKKYLGFSQKMNANTLDFSNIICEQEINALSKLCTNVYL